MLKIFVLISLCIAGIHGQYVGAPGGESSAAAEPYSYGYQTDSHGASEQRDPSGRVTGSYMLADADGRERRVEYYADESGFHAKVQTNEVGTKAENSADVEMLASPPSEGQLAYQTTVQQAAAPQFSQSVQQVPPTTSSVQTTSVQEQAVPLTTSAVSYAQQPIYSTNSQSVGYYPGSQVVSGYRFVPGYSSAGYSGQQYANQGTYGSYNNHLPSQYYRNVQTSGVQPQAWSSSASRYVSSQVSQPYASGYQGGYQVSGYQTVPSGVSYTTSQVGPAVSSRTVTTSRKVSTGVPSSSFQILKSSR